MSTMMNIPAMITVRCDENAAHDTHVGEFSHFSAYAAACPVYSVQCDGVTDYYTLDAALTESPERLYVKA